MTEADNPVERFVDGEFPVRFRAFLPPAMRLAYATVDTFMEQADFLMTPSGLFQRGQLIVKAVELQLFKLARSGSLPFEPKWEEYASPTGKHLVLHSPRSRITVNQVSEPSSKPRHAKFRENFGLNNTRYLWPEWNDEAERSDRLRHLLILHGYQDLNFVNIGFPHPTKDRLLYRTENFVDMPQVIGGTDERDDKREGPTEAPDLEPLEDLEKFLRDNKLDR
ncbi:hypothetical protein ROTAS13_02461 [Roseomonas sp. TAS13]|jgi:hypothetical protein|uniref:Uncharacterized protein n=2 Tax=Muricoccus TaxID=3409995 RepID=A0A840Y771_9PROT|nr:MULTISPECIES: hypothetical protein [Roseomonas]MBB5696006.1 hypothetical protein [Roseomonas pecuniae]USQ74564.1 hypothetical protein NF552_25040 [Roseomonas mucosa]GAV34791.1 hypothetical protein ROTAS13_02461 [Roseomonas sp. TAS13]SHK47040.1 hypothetical protein SAMN02745194_04984 [Roseomonas rosea]